MTGIVQGVGFRPFVHGLASRLSLRGFVKNRTGGALIEVEGELAAIDRFITELQTRQPRLVEIDGLRVDAQWPRGEAVFRIEASEDSGAGVVVVAPDIATCDDCLRELFDSEDRRYRYPFISCTHCGPRLTIMVDAPYDRERTTMARSRCVMPVVPSTRIRWTAGFTLSPLRVRRVGRTSGYSTRAAQRARAMMRSLEASLRYALARSAP